MSKKCCGIIYKDEKFCTLCGKELKDVPEELEVLDMDEVNKIAASVLGEVAEEEPKPASQESSEEEAPKEEAPKEEASKEEAPMEETSTEETPDTAKEASEEEEDDDDDDEEEDDGTASAGLKFFGTLIILLMIGSIALVGLGVYFIMLNPFYRNHDINNPVVYEQMSTDTDVTNIQTRPTLVPVDIESASPTDASLEDIATETDATDTDAADADVSEDME